MTLKEELEILRGEPIQVFTGNPMDIPCVETSDSERLCKHPVVSVSMITYNHEAYIRQAIEGVMMQKTDFEFELVIGEDCSTDSTREICFEYQKRYPDKIRVLWCDHNLYRNPHPAGGNSRRNMAHCRGEFIALCEGDDYWIDPLKLQKQVDVMRKYPNVGFCFCGSKLLTQNTGEIEVWNANREGFEFGLIKSMKYVLWTSFGKNPCRGFGGEYWQMTATFLVRKSVWVLAIKKYDIFSWKLSVGDSTLCISCGTLGDVYYLGDNVSVYRRTSTGITCASRGKCRTDTLIVRMYFAREALGLSYADLPDSFVERFVWGVNDYMSGGGDNGAFHALALNWAECGLLKKMIRLPVRPLWRLFYFNTDKCKWMLNLLFYINYYVVGFGISKKLRKLYVDSSADETLSRGRYRLSVVTGLRSRIKRVVSKVLNRR